jgi:hypothetical protein
MDNAQKNLLKIYEDVKGPSNQTEIDFIMAVKKAVERATETSVHITLSEKPIISRKPIVVWQGRMRIVNPTDCAFVSLVSLRHAQGKKENLAITGFIVIYIPEDTATMLGRVLGKTGLSLEDDILYGCGEYLNNIAELFKGYLKALLYEELVVGVPHNFGAHVDELVDYHEPTKFEVVFNHDEMKFLHVDIGIEKINKIMS